MHEVSDMERALFVLESDDQSSRNIPRQEDFVG